MKNPFFGNIAVITLTLSVAAVFSSCTYIQRSAYDSAGEVCRTHAYVDNDVESFLKQRFGSGSQVRTAILPYSVPAIFTGRNPESDFGIRLAKELQAALFQTHALPLVEVAFRPDWPGKQAEFFSGNYGALQLARDAGYDLVIVGMMEKESGPGVMILSTKLIEVESGITVWYAKNEIYSYRPDVQHTASWFGLENRTPSYMPIQEITHEAVQCIARHLAGQEDVT